MVMQFLDRTYWTHAKLGLLLDLQVESLLDLRIAVIRTLNTVPDRSGIFIDLVVVAALHRLVTEEVDRLIIDAARKVLVVLDVLQAVSLVPPGWEDVEGYLPTDRVAAFLLVAEDHIIEL